MHGLGNDFVVIDGRDTAVTITADLARALADRNRGVGFDQLALILPPATGDLRLQFWNADGSMAATCGNATRCIAAAEMARTGRDRLRIETDHGGLEAVAQTVDGRHGVAVNMGQPGLGWADIPLAGAVDTLHLPIEGDPVATSMGNPHMTFFVPDAEAVDLAARGAALENHPLYPERAPMCSSPISSGRTTCACGSGNGAPGSRWPAGPRPVQRPWLPRGAG